MDVVIVLVFVSLVLVAAAVAMFVARVRGGDFEHGERLSLLPLEDDGGHARSGAAAAGDAAEARGGGET